MKKVLPVLRFLSVLYLFFLCIELMGGSFKLIGAEAAKDLLTVTDNPFVGFLIGLVATSIMQSSSTTTSIVVGMVAAGTLTITQAVPMVMGANLGTTITNLIVSMGHMRMRKEFELAFAGATVHDFFNLCTVVVFLPLEIAFQPIQKTATFISELVCGVGGATFHSPLKAIVKPVVVGIQDLGLKVIPNPKVLGAILVVDTRKKIVEHLSISASHHVGGELVYLKVINDIERVGDYSKNLLDLANLMPEPLTEGCYYDRLKDLFPKVDGSFDKAERALFDGEEEDAKAVIQNHLQITRSCKDILASLIQDPKLYSHEAIAIALTARYFKRVSSHLKNVASTAVNPFSHIGYMGTPKVEDPEESPPSCE